MNKKKGFTLIELIVVMVVLSIVMALSLPNFRGMTQKSELKTASREIVSTVRLARSLAVFTGKLVVLKIDVDGRKYRLVVEKDEKEKEDDRVNTYERVRELPRDVKFSNIEADEGDLENNIVYVFFYQDGSASQTLITLENKKGRQADIEIYRNTGMARIKINETEK